MLLTSRGTVPPIGEAIGRNFGAAGLQWLAELPTRIATLERAWRLRWVAALETDGECAVIGVVRRHDGSDSILKLGFPHDEARHEGNALGVWGGHGAVRLLAVSDDGFALLLERCVPGDTLWSLDVDAGNAVVCDLARQLWVPIGADAPFTRLDTVVAAWCAQVPDERRAAGYAPEVVRSAVQLGASLCADAPASVLLHGDLHPGNILSAERVPWLAIDPKPVVGDPAFEWAQLLANRISAACTLSDPCAELTRQIRMLAASCGHDPARVAGWAVVKALGWDLGPTPTALLYAVWRGLA